MIETVDRTARTPPVQRRAHLVVGEPEPERLHLQAGDLRVTLQAGWLRWITFGDREILRGIYGALRDESWNTPQATVRDLSVDAESHRTVVRFTADLEPAGVPFRWDGRIELNTDGQLMFELDGSAREPVLVGRFGLCVMHPPSLAGQRVTLLTPDGERRVRLARSISASRESTDLTGMRWHPHRDLTAELRFEGERFELEDQRNWTDGSFKTFSRPLYLPWPYLLEPGRPVRQAVRLQLRGRPPRQRRWAPRPFVRVIEAEHPFPTIGTTWPGERSGLTADERKVLSPLELGHLRVVLDLGSGQWPELLAGAAEDARALGTALELEAVAGPAPKDWDDLARALVVGHPRIARILVFDGHATGTTSHALRAARRAFENAGLVLAVGGGSRQSFFELNRARMRLSALDCVGFPVSPQGHELDRASMVETLPIQAEAVRQARRRSRGRPVAVGPVTFRPIGPAISVAAGRTSLPDALQASLFGGAWLIGSIQALAAGGAASATYFDAVGIGGLMDRIGRGHPHWIAAGALFPIYHVIRSLAGSRAWWPTRTSGSRDASVQAVATRHGRTLTVAIANMAPVSQEVDLNLPESGPRRIATLEAGTAHAFLSDSAWIDRPDVWQRVDATTLVVPASAVAFVRAALVPHS